MTTGAGLLGVTLPMIIAGGVIVKVTDTAFKGKGKPVGSQHYHLKGKKATSHRHEGGHISHEHRGLRGYGRNRKTLRRL